jgi:SAM-dependent methyltransferase
MDCSFGNRFVECQEEAVRETAVRAMTKATAFEENTSRYDAWFEKHPDQYHAELEALRCLLPTTGRGVEIGVGTGRFAAPLGISLGVEPSPQMAEVARRRGIEVAKGVAESLPFADNSFDFAVMVTVVCFFDDVAKSFRETWRILKPGGTLVVGFIDKDSELGRSYSHNKEQSTFYKNAQLFSARELAKFLTQAGFSGFSYRQTLFPEETPPLTVQDGFGTGGFVVIQAQTVKRSET